MSVTHQDDGTPVTQIIYLDLKRNPSTNLSDSGLWKEALDLCVRAPGCERLYWGRSLEHPEHGQLHIVRRKLSQHQDFLQSSAFDDFVNILGRLTGAEKIERPLVRHAKLKSWGPDDKALARGAPFTGTAIYLNTTDAWDEGAWPLWTHVVRHIDGCLGGAQGPLLEPVETIPGPLDRLVNEKGRRRTVQRCSIVYVGWQTTEAHDAYHHTKHFAEHSVILRCGNSGFAEYGHIVFEGSRDRLDGEAKL